MIDTEFPILKRKGDFRFFLLFLDKKTFRAFQGVSLEEALIEETLHQLHLNIYSLQQKADQKCLLTLLNQRIVARLQVIFSLILQPEVTYQTVHAD